MLKRFVCAALFSTFLAPALAEDPTAAKAEDPDKTAISAAAVAPVGDGEPRALVIDITGTSEPSIAAFDELNDGANVQLEATAELALTFYPTCEDVMIRGGTVSIADGRLSIAEGEIVSRAKGECPGHVKLSPADVVNASIVTRSVKARPWISPRPEKIGLVGPTARLYDRIAVYSREGAIFEAPLDGRSVAWPEDLDPLEVGRQYVVVLTGEDVQMFAARVTPDEKAPRVTVFRLK